MYIRTIISYVGSTQQDLQPEPDVQLLVHQQLEQHRILLNYLTNLRKGQGQNDLNLQLSDATEQLEKLLQEQQRKLSQQENANFSNYTNLSQINFNNNNSNNSNNNNMHVGDFDAYYSNYQSYLHNVK